MEISFAMQHFRVFVQISLTMRQVFNLYVVYLPFRDRNTEWDQFVHLNYVLNEKF